jgi:hypothetical protein
VVLKKDGEDTWADLVRKEDVPIESRGKEYPTYNEKKEG